MKNRSHKYKKNKVGGDIYHNVFNNILSIGYEFESSNFAKLSLIKNNILLNTDTVAKNLSRIHGDKTMQGGVINGDEDYNEEEDEEENEEEDDQEEDNEEDVDDEDGISLRKQEKVKYDVYTSDTIDDEVKKPDPNALFQVLNDVAETPLNKYLTLLCKDVVEANIAAKKAELMENDDEYNPDEEDDDEILHEIKNDLYKFKTTSEPSVTYNINFETWDQKDCGTFSDIEWLFTYYKPNKSKTIILDTFINAIKNLIYHLSQLRSTPGNLIMQFSEEDKETINKPTNRLLYNYPNTNMYYLQTHRLEKKLTVDDVCIVPQMTFSCDIKHFIEIAKKLTRDSIGKLELNKNVADNNLDVIKRLERCVNLLFLKYNKDAGSDIFDMNNESVMRMKSYIFMILFKIYRYLNKYLIRVKEKKGMYLKDVLFLNSRHTNGELYKKLKMEISSYFRNDDEILNIIKDLIIQPSILTKYMLENSKNVMTDAFKTSYKLDKENPEYGNPYHSFVSYFDFLEDPIDDDNGDWFEYSRLDIYSTNMEINDNIILVELRSFAFMLRSYMSSIADNNLKTEMSSGICNIKNPDVNFVSISGLKQMIDLYEKNGIKTSSAVSSKSPRRSTMKKSVKSK